MLGFVKHLAIAVYISFYVFCFSCTPALDFPLEDFRSSSCKQGIKYHISYHY